MRYWRIMGIETFAGGDLELAEIALQVAGTRVEGLATFTSTSAPTAPGRWAGADVHRPNFVLQWDFGATPQAIDAVGLRGPSRAMFPQRLVVQRSSDAVIWHDLLVSPLTKWHDAQTVTWMTQENQSAHLIMTDLLLDYEVPVGPRSTLPDRSIYQRAVGSIGGNYSIVAGGVFGGNCLSMTGGTSAGPRIVMPLPLPGMYNGYTFEGWFRTASNTTQFLFRAVDDSGRLGSVNIYLLSDLRLQIETREWSSSQIGVSTLTAPVAQWFHVALVMDGVVCRAYLNGQLAITHTDSRGRMLDDADPTAWVMLIGSVAGGPNLNGLADETRLYRAALYTANFTPRTSPISHAFDPQPIRHTDRQQTTRISAFPPLPTVGTRTAQGKRVLYYGGPGRIVGTVRRRGEPAHVPVRRRVRLYCEIGRQLVAETWSDAVTGAYAFTDLNVHYPYTLITYDHEQQFRALTADRVMAVIP